MEKKTRIVKRKISLHKTVKKPAGKEHHTKALPENPKEIISILGLHNLGVPVGAHKPKKLLGRGPSSGHGKTSTRGSKGQTSRAGRHFYAGFEGGQSPLIRRMPKRGFTSRSKKTYQILNLDDLEKIKESSINLELLKTKGLIKDITKPVKILGGGELKNAVTVQANAFSKQAAEKIQKAGGKAEIINHAINH